MNIKIVVIFTLSIFVLGCAVATRSLPEEDDQNIVGELVRLKQSTDISFFEPNFLNAMTGNIGPREFEGMPAYQNWWCISGRNTIDKAVEAVPKYCEQVGGVYGAPWCRNELDEPIFYAKVGRANVAHPDNVGKVCSGSDVVDIGFWAITGQEQNPLDWKNVADTKLAYVSNAQVTTAKNEVVRKIVTDMVAAKKQILESGVGTQVCDDFATQRGIAVRVGYVEKIENSRLKISLNRAYMKNAPSISPTGVPLGEIWDNPEGWYPCR